MNKEKLIAAISEIFRDSGASAIVVYDKTEGLKYVIGGGMYPNDIEIEITHI